MRKIITLLVALFMTFTMATAQTVERGGVFSNMYVGISGGTVHNTVSDIKNFEIKPIDYNVAVELGKNVTPITGFSLNVIGVPNWNGGDHFSVDGMAVTGNIKFNMMNLFGGYKGYPRRFEIQTVTGIGWEHDFTNPSVNPNDMSLNAGLEFDFNLGKSRAWYIAFKPEVVAHKVIGTYQDLKPMAENARLQANLGVAYKFKSKKTGSHNFVICDKVYTEQQYADLYAMYDECMNRAPQIDTVIVEKVVEIEKVVEVRKNENTVITFDKNCATINPVEMQRLTMFMNNTEKDANILVVGSADSKTGSEEYNCRLANLRAEAIKNVLIENGFTNIITDSKLDAFDAVELSRSAVITCE